MWQQFEDEAEGNRSKSAATVPKVPVCDDRMYNVKLRKL